MEHHTEHEHVDHSGHGIMDHGHDGHVPKKHHGHEAHGTVADLHAAYTRAFEGAQPALGREVVKVDLAAGEFDWEFSPGRRTRAWGFNGTIPGPTIEARVGDVLEIRL